MDNETSTIVAPLFGHGLASLSCSVSPMISLSRQFMKNESRTVRESKLRAMREIVSFLSDCQPWSYSDSSVAIRCKGLYYLCLWKWQVRAQNYLIRDYFTLELLVRLPFRTLTNQHFDKVFTSTTGITLRTNVWYYVHTRFVTTVELNQRIVLAPNIPLQNVYGSRIHLCILQVPRKGILETFQLC